MIPFVWSAAGESQTFTIGDEDIFFFQDTSAGQPRITVASAATGEPWSRTNHYIRFLDEAEAARFLHAALIVGGLPHGWQ